MSRFNAWMKGRRVLGAYLVWCAFWLAFRVVNFGGHTWWASSLLIAFYVTALTIAVALWRKHGYRQGSGDRDDSGAGTGPGCTTGADTSQAIDSLARLSWQIGRPSGTSSTVQMSTAPTPREVLPRREGDLPIMAWKQARIVASRQGLRFAGIGYTATRYDAIATAQCDFDHGQIVWGSYGRQLMPPHEAPGEECSCGFYALKEPTDPRQGHYASVVSIEVELYGKVIVCEHGYRAEKQRVVAMHLPECCSFCGQEPTRFVLPNGYSDAIGVDLLPRCAAHVGPFDVVYEISAVEHDLEVKFS